MTIRIMVRNIMRAIVRTIVQNRKVASRVNCETSAAKAGDDKDAGYRSGEPLRHPKSNATSSSYPCLLAIVIATVILAGSRIVSVL